MEGIPKLIQIGKHCSVKEKREIKSLIREYRDIFAWRYEDLKAYKEDIIKHAIPFKDEA